MISNSGTCSIIIRLAKLNLEVAHQNRETPKQQRQNRNQKQLRRQVPGNPPQKHVAPVPNVLRSDEDPLQSSLPKLNSEKDDPALRQKNAQRDVPQPRSDDYRSGITKIYRILPAELYRPTAGPSPGYQSDLASSRTPFFSRSRSQ